MPIAAAVMLVLSLIVCLRLLQLSGDLGLLRASHLQRSPERGSSEEDPQTAVILCVRGADPSLHDCLRGLAGQTHSNFTVHVVVDHKSDPALGVLREAALRDRRIRIHEIPGPPPRHRGLKVTAILHAVRQLPVSVERVAFIDADVIAHPNWLRELTEPLADPAIGACTGTRWFIPDDTGLGSLVRTEWNFYATAFMVRHSILWGGSFAMRAAALEEALREGLWEYKLCEDTCLGDFFRRVGRRTVIVPSVAMANPETCTLSGSAAFITRQQTFTWLYSAAAGQIIGFGMIFTALCLITPVFAALAVWQGSLFTASAGVLAYVLLHAAVVQLEWRGHRLPYVLRPEMASQPVSSATPLWKLYVAQLLCAAISFYACVRAVFAVQMSWRGIQYRIQRSPVRVEMLQYRPFSETRTLERLSGGAGRMSI